MTWGVSEMISHLHRLVWREAAAIELFLRDAIEQAVVSKQLRSSCEETRDREKRFTAQSCLCQNREALGFGVLSELMVDIDDPDLRQCTRKRLCQVLGANLLQERPETDLKVSGMDRQLLRLLDSLSFLRHRSRSVS